MPENPKRAARKILWIFSSFEVGASQRRFATLLSRLGRSVEGDDYEHAICVLDGEEGAQTLIEPGARFRMLRDGAGKPGGRGIAGLALGRLWCSRRTLAAERPDLVVTAGLGAIEWLAVNRGPGAAPHLHFVDPVGPEEALEGGDGRGDWLRRRALAGRDRAYVAEGEECAELLTRRWGAKAESVHRMPWGVDLETVRPTASNGEGVVFGSLSPLVAEKRHDRMLRILASLRERERDVSLRLVGQGPERRRLEIQAESLGVSPHVTFIDRDGLDPRIAAEETARMDVYADFSDVSRSPAAPVLALAAGLPFIGSNSGAAAELASKENALFLRPAKDESALAAAAELLVADAALRAGIGLANRERAEERHGLDAMIEAYEALIEQLCGPAGRLALPAPEEARSVPEQTNGAAQEPQVRATPVETFLIGASRADDPKKTGGSPSAKPGQSPKAKLKALSETNARPGGKRRPGAGPRTRPAGA